MRKYNASMYVAHLLASKLCKKKKQKSCNCWVRAEVSLEQNPKTKDVCAYLTWMSG